MTNKPGRTQRTHAKSKGDRSEIGNGRQANLRCRGVLGTPLLERSNFNVRISNFQIFQFPNFEMSNLQISMSNFHLFVFQISNFIFIITKNSSFKFSNFKFPNFKFQNFKNHKQTQECYVHRPSTFFRISDSQI